MALVVLLRGVNVGGHRRFRPSALVPQLRAYEVVNIGAAGTFVVRKPGRPAAAFQTALASQLPFETEIIAFRGSELLRFAASAPFAGIASDAAIVRFVSVLAKPVPPTTALPLRIPQSGEWDVQILGQEGRFVFGVYRRTMRAIAALGQLDRLSHVPATTRNWNTMMRIVRALDRAPG